MARQPLTLRLHLGVPSAVPTRYVWRRADDEIDAGMTMGNEYANLVRQPPHLKPGHPAPDDSSATDEAK